MDSVWSVSKLSTESVGSRRELVANFVHTADADATKQFRRVGGVYTVCIGFKGFKLGLFGGNESFSTYAGQKIITILPV